MNLASILTNAVARDPEHVAVKLDDFELTYGQLDDASARFAGLLRDRGIQPGDRVAIMLPNVPHFAVCYYGILRAGGVVVPMNVLLKQREVALLPGRFRRAACCSRGSGSPRTRRPAPHEADARVRSFVEHGGSFETVARSGGTGARARRNRGRATRP